MSQPCLFCRIASGELPSHKVYEDDSIFAFLDLHPIREGHTLIIPRAHHVWFEDLPVEIATRITSLAQDIARSMKRLYQVERVSMFYTGIHVPHAHAHVVPMHHVHDVTSSCYLADGVDGYTTPPALSAEAMQHTARVLRAELHNTP